MKGSPLKLKEPAVFFFALALTLIGLLMSFDAAYPRAIAKGHGFIPPEFRSQLLVCILAPVVFLLATRVQLVWLKRLGLLSWIVVSCLLVAAVASPLKLAMNGAERWVKFGPVVIQPAEFAKLSVILYLAAIFASRKPLAETRKSRDWAEKLDHEIMPKVGQLLPLIWVLIALYFIDKEPDLGTAAVVGACALAIVWLGGISTKSLIVGAVILAVGAVWVVRAEPYRYERFVNHANRWEPKIIEGPGYQTVQSEVALANGGLLGTGIGQGRAKHILPAATTDFVMATVGEEFGLWGSLGVLALLGMLVGRLALAGQESLKNGNAYTAMILGGVAVWMGVQGCVNLLQANATLPPIGIPFPFVSSGGSSLLALWAALGICEAAMRTPGAAAKPKEEEPEDRSNRWRDGRAYLSSA